MDLPPTHFPSARCGPCRASPPTQPHTRHSFEARRREGAGTMHGEALAPPPPLCSGAADNVLSLPTLDWQLRTRRAVVALPHSTPMRSSPSCAPAMTEGLRRRRSTARAPPTTTGRRPPRARATTRGRFTAPTACLKPQASTIRLPRCCTTPFPPHPRGSSTSTCLHRVQGDGPLARSRSATLPPPRPGACERDQD